MSTAYWTTMQDGMESGGMGVTSMGRSGYLRMSTTVLRQYEHLSGSSKSEKEKIGELCRGDMVLFWRKVLNDIA
ncbi:uncharacterized protein LOC143255619 isoform X2 [Tachypleus tridentatus]|uniref:uncharacterized protein LOC143255619 isoform X2 n=1 Tax=Tachypleus tridentatus TaxID=6853 RepID=UPI003FD4E877